MKQMNELKAGAFHQVTLEVVQSSPPREHLQQLPLKQFHPKRSHGAIEVNLASPYATLCCLTGMRCLQSTPMAP